jgi:hypothetical protein
MFPILNDDYSVREGTGVPEENGTVRSVSIHWPSARGWEGERPEYPMEIKLSGTVNLDQICMRRK